MGMGPGTLHEDIMTYLAGGEPSAEELASAPLLEEWSARANPAFGTGPWRLGLRGTITGHPSIVDGDTASTSDVAWLDRKHRWARTRSRVYRLGKRAEGGGGK